MFEKPIATVDAVLLTLEDNTLKVVVHKRGNAPFQGLYALPGGYFHTNEDINAEDAITRVIDEKVGIKDVFLEQLYTASGKDRDPRGWSLSVVFMGIFPPNTLHKGLELIDVNDMPQLAFDHNHIVEVAVSRFKGKGAYSTLPAHLLTAPFSLGQLQKVYENILDVTLDASAFRRKITALDLLEKTEGTTTGRGRPGTLWRLKEDGQTFNKRSLKPT